jgi:sugar phosphate isomerase/epimerase
VSDRRFVQDATVTPFGLSTWCRRSVDSPADFCARASELGASSIAVDATVGPAWLTELVAVLERGSLPASAIEAPCPRPRGERAPRLAATEKDERREAILQTTASIELGEKIGARVLVLRLGRMDMKDGWRESVRAFMRGSWKAQTARRQLAERSHLSARALDQARFSLEPLLERAADAGVTLALANRARWFEFPDAAEIGALLEDFRGAPLGAWFDAAAAHALECMSGSRAEDVLAALAPRLAGAWLGDAAGLVGGLPWGRGEIAREALLAGLPEAALRIVHAAPGAGDEELRAAIGA